MIVAQPQTPRLALVRARFDAQGGAERFVQSALGVLHGRGVDVTLITRRWPRGDTPAIVVNPFHLGSLWRDSGFARAACAALAERHFDLVQSHERIACCDIYRAGDGVHASWLEARARVQRPMARAATWLSPHHRYVLAAERSLFASPRLKAVICNAELVREDIARRFGVPPDRLVLIRNAVDSTHFQPGQRNNLGNSTRARLGIPVDATVFVLVGSGFERKGVAAFLHALARRREPAWGLIVGRDKRERQYGALSVRLGVAPRVRFVGGASDVRPLLAAADAFVLPAVYDPFPNAVLEAMASGLPVVTSANCGSAELIEEGVNGFVRDALDIAGLAAALDRLDPSAAQRMGEAARAAVAALTPERMAGEFVALYERLLGAKLG